ncbi:MAG: hypothetical protein ABIQ74_12500 [Chitinophagales bacterium]
MKILSIPFVGLLFSILVSIPFFIPEKSTHSFEKNEEPSDWFLMQRSFPYGKVDYQAYRYALEMKASMGSPNLLRDYLQWQQEGPTNIGGRVQDIEMDPVNPDIIYVGGASGGIFKSVDGGIAWTAIFDGQPSLSIGDIAVSPSDPDIVYAGTGEPNCGGGSVTYDGAGIFKSTDAGATWNYAGLDSTRNTGRIVIDPKNSDRVFAATMGDLFSNGNNRGIYRTTDGGQSWQQILIINDSTGVIDMAINPQNPDTLYACSWERVRRFTYQHYGGASCGIWRSYDGGDTWNELTNGLPSTDVGRIGIDISVSNPGVLYSIYADQSGEFKGIYKSSDGGDSWNATSDGSLGSMFASYGWWFGRIKIDPTDDDIVYAIGFETYKTINGGSSWSVASGSNHVDHHSIYIHPLDHQLVYEGTDGGVYKSTNGTASWTHIPGLPINQFYTCEIDYTNPSALYGGLQDNGVVRTITGNTDDWDAIVGGDGFYVLVDSSDNDYGYGESQYGALQRTVNGWNTSFGATNGISNSTRKNWNTPVAFNPLNTKSLFYGANKMYKTLNRAQQWNSFSDDLTNGYINSNITYATITTIAVSPVDTSIVFAGTDDGNAWVTQDNGINWLKISDSLPVRWVTRIICDPYEPNTAFITLSGYRFADNMAHVYRTTDLGATWNSISGNLPDVPVNDLIIDPLLDSTLYLATDAGVLYTSDLGNTWFTLGFDLPAVPVTDLNFYEPARKLVAATYGRSMYSLDLNTFTQANQPQPIPFYVTVFPSIVDNYFTVKMQGIGMNSAAHFTLLNEEGKVIWNHTTQKLHSGINSIRFSLNELFIDHDSGFFFLKTQVNGRARVNKIVFL